MLHARTLLAVARTHVPCGNGRAGANEAEEVLQESALRAWRDRARLDRPERFLAWFSAIVQHAAAVERLPAPLREVIELAYFADLTYSEIAAVIEKSVPTVNLRLAQARTALRLALGDEHA